MPTLWIDSLARSLRRASRSLVRAPHLTIAAVLTLAVGIGANAAVFSVVRAVILRPLPFPDGDRLVRLSQVRAGTQDSNVAPVRLADWQQLNTTLESISGYYVEDATDTSGELPQAVRRAMVAPRFFDVWKITPRLGRSFSESEHRVGGTPVVVIGERYWRSRMDSDAEVLTRTLRIDGKSFAIVGVMPDAFPFLDGTVDVWLPSAIDDPAAQSRAATWYSGVGRLKTDVTLARARADLDLVQSGLATRYPEFDRDVRAEIVPLKDAVVGTTGSSIWLLFGGVSVLLVIACTNVSGLLLARATHRRREIAVRHALGGSRLALATEILSEATIVTLAGALLGIVLAAGGLRLLREMAPAIPRIEEVSADWGVVAYTTLSAAVVVLLCGLVPAMRVTRGDLALEVSTGGRAEISGRGSLQWLLVGVQVTLSVTLLIGSGLLLRHLVDLSRVDAGFNLEQVLTFRVSGHFAEMRDYASVVSRVENTIEGVRSLPGVEAVATTTQLPGLPASFESSFRLVEGGDDTFTAESRVVSPEYFETLQIPMVAGDRCRRQPRGVASSAMVNRTFASRYLWGRPSPVGLHLVQAGAAPSAISGVVEDAREAGLDRAPRPTVYVCNSVPNPVPQFLARTTGDPQAVVASVRRKIAELQPSRSVYDIVPLGQRIDGAYAENRLRAALLGSFALAALALAAIGLYGTVGYVVGSRRREIAQRLALGAQRGEIVGHYLLRAVTVVGAASGVGVLLASGAARLFAGAVAGMVAFDSVVFSIVVVTVLIVGGVAASVPAMRGALVDPMRVLRE